MFSLHHHCVSPASPEPLSAEPWDAPVTHTNHKSCRPGTGYYPGKVTKGFFCSYPTPALLVKSNHRRLKHFFG